MVDLNTPLLTGRGVTLVELKPMFSFFRKPKSSKLVDYSEQEFCGERSLLCFSEQHEYLYCEMGSYPVMPSEKRRLLVLQNEANKILSVKNGIQV